MDDDGDQNMIWHWHTNNIHNTYKYNPSLSFLVVRSVELSGQRRGLLTHQHRRTSGCATQFFAVQRRRCRLTRHIRTLDNTSLVDLSTLVFLLNSERMTKSSARITYRSSVTRRPVLVILHETRQDDLYSI